MLINTKNANNWLFISMINTTSESFKGRNIFIFGILVFVSTMKVCAQLSMKKINLGTKTQEVSILIISEIIAS